ncbi:MAG: RNB domain-containing ribonuclease [Solirubrobacterales bacterium]
MSAAFGRAFGAGYGPMAAVLVPKGRALVARPLFDKGAPIQLKQEGKRSRPLRANELVLIEPAGVARGKNRGRQVTQPVGQIVRRIGDPDNARDVIEALMLERGLARRFDGKVENYARGAAEGADEFARRDLTNLPTFTMDPLGAKDFDDAISAERDGDNIRIWVHIADVSAFVRPGDPVDKEARRRATSVYVPGAVEPMLPEALSNNACSLVPGEPRRAVTTEILFNGDEPVSASFYRSTVRSDARLSYDEIDEVFAGRAQAQDPWAEPLALGRKVSAALQAKREKRKALAVESSEPAFEFGAAGDPTDVKQAEQTESHRVIEHLMIAANEEVAKYLDQHHLHALFRVHERPDPASVELLAQQLESLDVPVPPMPEHFTDQQAETIVGEISALVAAHVRSKGHGGAALTSLVLRSLKQAVYSPHNLGHSGLRSDNYCHFTSPIRRYPDLIVHRALLAGLGVDDAAPIASKLADEAESTSTRERAAMKIERRADDIVRTFLLEKLLVENGWKQIDSSTPHHGGNTRPSQTRRRPPRFADADELRENALQGPTFEGEISGMVGGGLFVAFGPQLQFEGFIGLRDLKSQRGGFWHQNELQTILEDEDSGHQIKIGTPVEVGVVKLQTARARVDLLPVSI